MAFIDFSLAWRFLLSIKCFAIFSSFTSYRVSPASGTSVSPIISTGVDGPANFTFLPLSFTIERILPIDVPTTTVSPTSSLPLCTSIDAIAPLFLSSLASKTAPLACLFGLAFNSKTSASNNTISSN